MKILLVDHDDSFTYNLQHWLTPLCANIQVVNHRDLQKNLQANLIVLSPGPKNAIDYPHVLDFISQTSARTAVYGVCLGLQILVHASGGKVSPYTPPLHGKKSKLVILHKNYYSLNHTQVARYHSLYCTDYNKELFDLLAVSDKDQIPMWLKHKQKKWMDVQFHPESFLTEQPELHLKMLIDWLST